MPQHKVCLMVRQFKEETRKLMDTKLKLLSWKKKYIFKKSSNFLLTQLPEPICSGIRKIPAADTVVLPPHTAEAHGWVRPGAVLRPLS